MEVRRREAVLAFALFAALLLVVSFASAAQVLTVTASRSAITYLDPLRLTVTTAESVPATITVQRRYPDGPWSVIRTIPASAAVEATSFVVPARPAGTAGFRAVQDGVESAVTTVTVKARLSKPVVASSIRAGRAVVVKGFIWPRHALGTKPVALDMWWRARQTDAWQLKATVEPTIVGRVAFGAKWAYSWQPLAADKGLWKLATSHADAMHEPNTSGAKYLRVR